MNGLQGTINFFAVAAHSGGQGGYFSPHLVCLANSTNSEKNVSHSIRKISFLYLAAYTHQAWLVNLLFHG